MKHLSLVAIFIFVSIHFGHSQTNIPEGFASLFDGESFNHWKVPEGDNGHWKVLDGVIDYDAESEAEEKNLWTEKSYRNFVLQVDWRIKATPYVNPRVPMILPSGLHKLDENGEQIRIAVPDSDSGILLRGQPKSQVNIWCWPTGSGEVYGYRMDQNMPANVRSAVVPKVHADNQIGEWNRFEISVIGEHLTVNLNGHTVIKNAWLPDLPTEGPIGLQHHGVKRDGEWVSPPSLVQFKNIYIKELPDIVSEMTDHPNSSAWMDLIAKDFSNTIAPSGVWYFNNDILTAIRDEAIWSDRAYHDYILDLEFQTAEGSNSGVILHCSDIHEWIPNSIEVQIADDYAPQWANSPKNWQCGAIFGHLAATHSTVKKPGEWNRYTIVAQARMIHVMLNGEWIAHMNMDQWTDAKVNPDGSEIPEWLSKPVATLKAHGHIGLQGKHAGAPIFFRNVKIKQL